MELSDFNEVIEYFFVDNEKKIDSKYFWDNKFKDIIKLGYKLLEGISKVKEKKLNLVMVLIYLKI
jgi:hypothetical protein